MLRTQVVPKLMRESTRNSTKNFFESHKHLYIVCFMCAFQVNNCGISESRVPLHFSLQNPK